MSAEDFIGADHLAEARKQTVHCQNASFIALGGIPTRTVDRLYLGFHLGFGLVLGGVSAAGLIAVLSKAIKALGL